METKRVVEIKWEGGYGSGYLVAPGIVLTARHVLEVNKEQLPKLGRKCRVRAVGEDRSNRPDWHDAELVWVGKGELDVALLRTGTTDRTHRSPPFGTSPSDAAEIKCRTIGFPLATAETPAGDDIYQLDGTIRTATFALSGELAVDVDSEPPEDPENWPGISGAALFADDYLVGVIKSYPRKFGGRMLKATSLAGLADDPAFCAALGQPCPLSLQDIVIKTDETLGPKTPRPVSYDLPSLPPNYQERPEALEAVKSQLLGDAPAVGVHGMAGIGKTVLATALIHDKEVERAFPDGIVWLTFGREAETTQKQAELADALRDKPHSFRNWEHGRGQLSQITQSERLLVVLDDLWCTEHVNPFSQVDGFSRLGPDCRLLVTTRDQRILDRLKGADHELKLLSHEASLNLLAGAAKTSLANLPAEAPDVVKHCGRLPLALASTGALIAKGRFTWAEALDRLCRADIKRLRAILPDYKHKGVLAALEVSVNALEPQEYDGFLDCAVFPEDVAVPEAALLRLWSSRFDDPEDARDLADLLVDLTLLRREQVQTGEIHAGETRRYQIHDLYHDYLVHAGAPLPPRHEALLRAYDRDCPYGWASGPADGYFFRNLVRHLVLAMRTDEAQTLLMTYRWIASKLDATGIAETIDDYDKLQPAPQTPLGLVREALRMSSHVLSAHPEELPGHLVGRLLTLSSEPLTTLLHQVNTDRSEAWLRPMTPSPFSVPREGGGQFFPHGDSEILVFCFGDGRAVSVGAVDAPKVWDTRNMVDVSCETRWSQRNLSKGVSIWEAVIDGRPRVVPHKDQWLACAVGCEGSRLLVGNREGDVFVFDAGTSGVRVIGQHDEIRDIDISHDGLRAVSGGNDNVLKYWDLESGREISKHDAGDVIDSVAISPDGRSAVYSFRWNARLIFLADLEKSEAPRQLDQLSEPLLSLRFEPNGQYVVAGCYDGWLRRYALRNGQLSAKFGRHGDDAVISMAFTGNHALATTARKDDRVGIWDTRHTQPSDLVEHWGQSTTAFAYLSPELAISGSADGNCRTWDLPRGRLVDEQPLGIGHISQIVATPSAVVIDAHVGISKWMVVGERLQRDCPDIEGMHIPGTHHHVGFDEGGDRALRACEESRLESVDIESGDCQVLCEYSRPGDSIYITAISPIRRQRALVATRTVDTKENYLEAWNTESRERLWGHKWPKSGDAIRGAAISPDGRIAATGSFECCLSIWSVDGEQPLLFSDKSAHRGPITMLAFARGGERLLSAARDDRYLNVWEIDTSTSLRQLNLGSPIVSFVTTRDRQYVWISLQNRRMIVWDIDHWTEVARLEADCAVVLDAVAPDALGALGHETGERRNAVILKLENPPS